VRVVVGPQTGGGLREQASYRVSRALKAGQTAQVRTGIGPMNAAAARRYGAIVSDARLAE
jgi:hypothetical protein